MSELAAGLAASANDPVAETTTIDATLDAAFSSPEPAASSEPSGQPEPAHEPVAATQQPQEPAKPETQTGEPPKERWDSILANARTKAKEEALAEHRDALEIVQRLRSDFSGTLTQLLDEGIADQRFADTLTTKAAAILAARRQQAKQDVEPEADLQTADGALVYSAEQSRKWQEWNTRQMERKFGEQFKPLMELQQQFASLKQRAADQEQANTIAAERGEQWKQMPFFEDHKAAILERQQALYAELEAHGKQGGKFDAVNAPWVALQQAYREVVTAQALPKLQAQQTQQMVDSAARKRAGSASDPAAAAPAQPRKPRTVDEALDQVFSAVAI